MQPFEAAIREPFNLEIGLTADHLEPRPVDLLDAVDRLDWISSFLVAAGGRLQGA